MIKDYAFYGCNELTKVTISNSVKHVGISAFQNCSSLSFLTIGSGVTSIGKEAFQRYGGSSLDKIYCYANTPPLINASLTQSSFGGVGYEAILYVPVQCGEKYKLSDWGTYFKKIEEMD